ncbi:MAG: DMT family transporter [Cyanobacteria bacterium REEB67]|nr:DMT family transporter [Cyanobacteria bacterium REEB67]
MPARAYVILLLAQLAIGAAAIFARLALTGSGPLMASTLRLCLATILIVSYRSFKKRLEAVSHRHEMLFACAGLCLALHFACWIASLQFTSVAISTLLVCTSPIWTALWDLTVGREKPKMQFFLSFTLGACGVYLIAFAPGGGTAVAVTSTSSSQALLGDALAASGGLAIAAYLIAVRRVSNTYTTSTIVVRTYAWASAALILLTLVSGEHLPTGPLSWGGILAMALISQLLGHTAINQSLRWLSPSTVAMTTLLEPVLAAISAAVLFHEALTGQALCGSALVLIALYGILRGERKAGSEKQE